MSALAQPAAAAVPSADVLVPCGTGCRFAEPLPAGDGDWIWCHRPGALNRIRSTASDCTDFDARITPADLPPC